MAGVTVRPRIFISSAWRRLADDRIRVADRLEHAGFHPFRFEQFREQADWNRFTPAENENTCLGEIDRSDFVVGLVEDEYGGSGADHAAGIALTDLELFQAIRARKPLRVYVLNGHNRVPEVAALLMILRTVLSDAVVDVATRQQLPEIVAQDVERHFGKKRPSGTDRMAAYSRRMIVQRAPLDDELTGLRFLRGEFPRTARPFDPNQLSADLVAAEPLRPHDVRLAALWEVLQCLFAAPWTSDRRSLDLWDRALSAWNKSAAWCGQHGLQFAGALAADNSLIGIRSVIASGGEAMTLTEILKRGDRTAGEPTGWIRLYGVGGALGSEYYSIAKTAPFRLRRHYLEKADAWCVVAERSDAIEAKAGIPPSLFSRASRASIRGQVRLALGDAQFGIRLLEQSLQWRIECGANPADVGWAKIALAHADHLHGSRKRADRLLTEGIYAVEQTGSPEFVVRAKKRAAQIYLRQRRFRDAGAQLDEAWDIAADRRLGDQLADLSRLVPRVLRSLYRLTNHYVRS